MEKLFHNRRQKDRDRSNIMKIDDGLGLEKQ